MTFCFCERGLLPLKKCSFYATEAWGESYFLEWSTLAVTSIHFDRLCALWWMMLDRQFCIDFLYLPGALCTQEKDTRPEGLDAAYVGETLPCSWPHAAAVGDSPIRAN